MSLLLALVIFFQHHLVWSGMRRQEEGIPLVLPLTPGSTQTAFQAGIEIKLCRVLCCFSTLSWACLGLHRAVTTFEVTGLLSVSRDGGVSHWRGEGEALELRLHLTFPGERVLGFLVPWG